MAVDDPIGAGDLARAGTTALDGRSARRLRTRARIIAALRELVLEGHARPTAESIAQRAEVSLRSIYQHFSDLNDLFSEFAAESLRSAASSAAALDPCANLDTRITSVVQQRDRLYADIGASARLALALEHDSSDVSQALQAIRQQLRLDVTGAFATELANIVESERDERLEACMTLLSFSSYDLLRTRQGLSRARYLSTLRVALRQLLAP